VAGTPTSTERGTPLNLKQVAQRLGVHYMTAYRYVRQGHLPARQEGTVWVVDSADVDRFAEERDAPPTPADDGSRVDWSERVRAQLVMGNEVEAWAMVDHALASGVTAQRAFIDLLGGSVAIVGSQVDAGEATTADLHIARVTAQRVAVRLGARFRRRRPSRGTVILGAPPGERHELPIAIIADLLRLEAFDVLELGPDAPADAFAVAAERAERPAVVGLGVTRIDHIESARQVVAAVKAAAPDVPVVVGGQAVRSPEVAALLGVDAWAPDGETVVATIEGLLGL
jgi:excisionase family DNA binding protein